MNNKRNTIFFALGILLLFSVACGFSASTANIKEARMAREVNGAPEDTTTFAPNDVFYCLVTVANAPDDTVVKAVWKAVDAEGVEKNYTILETEYNGGGEITFQASNDNPWPVGKYAVELYIDDKLKDTVEFSVAENGAAGGSSSGSTGNSGNTAGIGDEIGVDSAYMARFVNDEPQKTTSYAADEIFYCVVQLTRAESDTNVRAVWTAVDVEGADANTKINETDITGEDLMKFQLSNQNAWPVGSYKVEIYVNDEYQGYLDFSVE